MALRRIYIVQTQGCKGRVPAHSPRTGRPIPKAVAGFHSACCQGHLEAIKLVGAGGLDVNIQNLEKAVAIELVLRCFEGEFDARTSGSWTLTLDLRGSRRCRPL